MQRRRCRQLVKKLHVAHACPRGWDTHLSGCQCRCVICALMGIISTASDSCSLASAWVVTNPPLLLNKKKRSLFFLQCTPKPLRLPIPKNNERRLMRPRIDSDSSFWRVLPPNCYASTKEKNSTPFRSIPWKRNNKGIRSFAELQWEPKPINDLRVQVQRGRILLPLRLLRDNMGRELSEPLIPVKWISQSIAPQYGWKTSSTGKVNRADNEGKTGRRRTCCDDRPGTSIPWMNLLKTNPLLVNQLPAAKIYFVRCNRGGRSKTGDTWTLLLITDSLFEKLPHITQKVTPGGQTAKQDVAHKIHQSINQHDVTQVQTRYALIVCLIGI